METQFEQRWLQRTSRLMEFNGFRYFHLMRRVDIEDTSSTTTATTKYDGGGKDKKSQFGNYVSFTVWENENDFATWRKGDAFREAHGGTSVGAFVSTMIKSLKQVRGKPKLALYDGLTVQSTKPEEEESEVVGKKDIALEDGTTLPPECFVACNQFFVPDENSIAFEQRWAKRESQLKSCEGFVSFSMMRRNFGSKDNKEKLVEEEPTYVSCTIWKDRASFDKWRSGANFSKGHGQSDKGGEKKEEKKKPTGPPQWSRPPKPIFYEGMLVVSTKDGA